MRLAACWFAVGIAVTSARGALAQDLARTEIVAPKLLEGSEAQYPEGAKGDARLLCEVLVGVDGLVQEARVVPDANAVAAPEFATAALAAVRGYRFEPALREGKPVRARVRVVVTFSAPPPPPPAAPEPSAPAAVPTAKPSAPEEVRVRGQRYELRSPTERRMGRAEIRLLPGAFGDPFRAIDIMPGVIPTISGLPYYYVRGAPPAAVGYFVDEVRVPYLFHFGLGPGVIQPALINEVALHPAAYPARFGRFSGGIIAGETSDPPSIPLRGATPAGGGSSGELHGEGLIRLYDAGAFVEAPLAKGRATVAVGGRYSYTGLLLSLFSPEANIQYQDYNARFTYKLNDRTRLTAFAFGAYDYASITEQGQPEQVVFASEFHRLDLRLDRSTDRSRSRVAVTFGLDRTRLEDVRFARDYVLALRARHRILASDQLEIEAGADTFVDFYDGDLPSRYAVTRTDYDVQSTLYSSRVDTATGAWVSALLRPGLGMEFTATARGDIFTSAGAAAISPSPRFSGRVPITKRVAAVFALAIAQQPPAFAIPLPAVGYRGLPGGLSYAYQKSAGVDVKLPLAFNASVVGFHHTYANLRDALQARDNIDLDATQVENNGRGQAYGLEVLLRRQLVQRVSATLSYTLSRSELGSTRTRPGMVNLFDRTHVLQLASAVDLSRGWFASARGVLYTGWPDIVLSGRLPAFFRLDARLEKRWTWRKRGHLSLIFEGLNVTASREILSQQCESNGKCEQQAFGPIVVPSIGFEGAL